MPELNMSVGMHHELTVLIERLGDAVNPPKTRDEEIEALAKRIFLAHHAQWSSEHGMCASDSAHDAFRMAEDFIEHRDAWRERRAEG